MKDVISEESKQSMAILNMLGFESFTVDTTDVVYCKRHGGIVAAHTLLDEVLTKASEKLGIKVRYSTSIENGFIGKYVFYQNGAYSDGVTYVYHTMNKNGMLEFFKLAMSSLYRVL